MTSRAKEAKIQSDLRTIDVEVPIEKMETISESTMEVEEAPRSLAEAVQQGLLDPTTGQVKDPNTDKVMTLDAAAQKGLISSAATALVDPDTKKPLTWTEAVDQGIIDATTGVVLKPEGVLEVPLEKPPMTIGLLSPRSVTEDIDVTVPPEQWTTPKPLEKYHSDDRPYGESLVDAIDAGQYDPETGLFTDPSNSLTVNLRDALDYGLFDEKLREIVDPVTKKRLNLREAIDQGLVDPVKDVFIHPVTKEVLTLDKAKKLGYINKELTP